MKNLASALFAALFSADDQQLGFVVWAARCLQDLIEGSVNLAEKLVIPLWRAAAGLAELVAIVARVVGIIISPIVGLYLLVKFIKWVWIN